MGAVEGHRKESSVDMFRFLRPFHLLQVAVWALSPVVFALCLPCTRVVLLHVHTREYIPAYWFVDVPPQTPPKTPGVNGNGSPQFIKKRTVGLQFWSFPHQLSRRAPSFPESLRQYVHENQANCQAISAR